MLYYAVTVSFLAPQYHADTTPTSSRLCPCVSVHIFAVTSQCYKLITLPIPVETTPCIATAVRCSTAICTTLPPQYCALLCRYVTMTIHLATTPLPVPTALCISAPLQCTAIALRLHTYHCHAFTALLLTQPCPAVAYHYSTDTHHRPSHLCHALTELVAAILSHYIAR